MKASPESIRRHIAEIKRFCRIYNTSESFGEVVRRIGGRPGGISTKAASFRRRGIRLQMFNHSTAQKEIDWEGIGRYAEGFLK